jgi:hypothetical protein
MDEPLRLHGRSGPFVDAEPRLRAARDEHGVQRREPEVTPARRIGRDDEEPVVPAGSQSADSPHGVPAEPVCDQPFPRGRLVEVPADLPPEPDLGHT